MCDCVVCTHDTCGLAGVNMTAVASGFGDSIDDRCDNDPDDDSDDGIREDSSGDGDDEDNSGDADEGGGGVGWSRSKNFAPHFRQLGERHVLFLQQIVSRKQSGEGGYTWTTPPITRRVFDNNIPHPPDESPREGEHDCTATVSGEGTSYIPECRPPHAGIVGGNS